MHGESNSAMTNPPKSILEHLHEVASFVSKKSITKSTLTRFQTARNTARRSFDGPSAQVANSIRVIKTKNQTSNDNCSYFSATQQIIEKDGVPGQSRASRDIA